TFNLFTPVIQWWARHGHGGVLVLDGKGAAGDELLGKFIAKHGLGHRALLIKPGIRLGWMEGLEPGEFIDAIFDVGGAAKQEVDQDKAEFFLTQARKFGLALAWILHTMVAAERSNPNTSYRWTVDSFDRLKALLKQDTPVGRELL